MEAMKQSEFQDSIVWLDGMEYCWIDGSGNLYQCQNEPDWIYNKYEYTSWSSRCEFLFALERFIPDPENWLFKRTGEI